MIPQVLRRPVRDISQGIGGAIDISPPVQAARFGKDLLQGTRSAQNPKRDVMSVFKGMRMAGYANPIAPLLGLTFSGGGQMVSNFSRNQPMMSGLDEAAANGLSSGAFLGALSKLPLPRLGTKIKGKPPSTPGTKWKTVSEYGHLRRDRRFK